MDKFVKTSAIGRRAVFLDRDGVINYDPGYVHKTEDLKLFPGVASTIAKFKQSGFLVIVVTNQSGIARGMFSFDDVARFHAAIQNALAKEVPGSQIDHFYICPHFPEAKVKEFATSCACRKPKTANMERAKATFGISLADSFMIGDRESDIVCGNNAGTRTILIAESRPDTIANVVCKNLPEAYAYIMSDQ